jgi:tRNA dimethylallyltransferase
MTARGRAQAPPIVAVVGPTATGKSDLALGLAPELGAEIVVADSRQVYAGMDVGTATPSAEARAAVPHHLLDLVAPDEPFTVAQWVAAARERVAEIERRSRRVLVVGGTGLYVSALIDGHDYASQPWSPEIRARLAAELDADGLAQLVARLERADAAAARAIDLRNPRRVLRALERVEAGGAGVVPRSEPYPGRVVQLGLARPRAELYRRIDARARWMFEHGGLVAEVRRLLDAGYGPDLPPMSGHGYAEAMRHLAGEWSLEEAIEVTARRTRQYAKRQLSWFRRDPRIAWLDAGGREAGDPALVGRALELAR